MYGSNFCSVTVNPRASRSAPMEAAAMPLPSPETTPPVMKMYFVLIGCLHRKGSRFEVRRKNEEAETVHTRGFLPLHSNLELRTSWFFRGRDRLPAARVL